MHIHIFIYMYIYISLSLDMDIDVICKEPTEMGFGLARPAQLGTWMEVPGTTRSSEAQAVHPLASLLQPASRLAPGKSTRLGSSSELVALSGGSTTRALQAQDVGWLPATKATLSCDAWEQALRYKGKHTFKGC